MVTRVRDLKGAFIACCARDKGLPMGRTAFQDFEIAYFLNMAYDKCVKTRVDALAQANYQIGTTHMYASRDQKTGNILSELGALYAPQPQEMELSVGLGLNDYRFKLWGRNSRVFEIRPVNGAMPYIVGADLHEVAIQDRKEADRLLEQAGALPAPGSVTPRAYAAKLRTLREGFFANLANLNVTWPIRILQGPEVMDFSMLLRGSAQNIERLPYRVGRVRTFMIETAARFTDAMLGAMKNAIRNVFKGKDSDTGEAGIDKLMTEYYRHEPLVCLELLHPMYHDTPDKYELFCSIETIKHPRVITEHELRDEVENTIECNFGYEIAETAADIAMKVLSAGGMKPQPGI
jgi:hypothetical protein